MSALGSLERTSKVSVGAASLTVVLWRDVDAPCRGGGFGAIGDSELGQDVADVHADSLLADEQVLGDTPVAEPVGETRE
jgi:hypothetical protein